MKIIALLCALLGASLHGAPSPAFFKALHHVETSGRYGATPGDFVNGVPRALGPMQIHTAYFKDSGVPGTFSQCAGYEFSVRVVSAYLQKYAPEAWARGDRAAETLARTHNGGPQGARRASTLAYSRAVRAAFSR